MLEGKTPLTGERIDALRSIGERTGYFTQAERLELFAELDRARLAESRLDAALTESVRKDDLDDALRRLGEATAALATAREELETFRTALTKISAIRDSIVGLQGFNFSEHAYPLVAALNEAGFEGRGYEIARKNLGTLLEQIEAAESDRDAAREALRVTLELLREARNRTTELGWSVMPKHWRERCDALLGEMVKSGEAVLEDKSG